MKITEKSSVSFPVLLAILGAYGYVIVASYRGEATAAKVSENEVRIQNLEKVYTKVEVMAVKIDYIEKAIKEDR